MSSKPETLGLSLLLREHEEIAALRAENERLRSMAWSIEERWLSARDRANHAEDENERLRAALSDAIDLAEEGWAYAGDYFREKWDVEERLKALVHLPNKCR